jgi:hypothetical protein
MTWDERYNKRDQFVKELKALLHKTMGTVDFNKADSDLLDMLQDCTSLYQPYMWKTN